MTPAAPPPIHPIDAPRAGPGAPLAHPGPSPTTFLAPLAHPVRIDLPPPPPRPRVTAIVPCFNRPADAAALLADLALAASLPGAPALHVLLVDNASDEPLSALPTPPGLSLEHLRLPRNTGGSGGFSAGLAHALAGDTPAPDHLWLVDSDARVAPGALPALAAVLAADPTIVAAGAALHDPLTGQCFEVGGRLNRRTGLFEPAARGSAGLLGAASTRGGSVPGGPVRGLVECDYLAACCALVRADAARAAGPFPDAFLNADDVEWFIRMAQRTGGRIVAVPWARAAHPRFDRFPTWTRYYTTRNAHVPLDAVAAGPRPRLARALRDAARAALQSLTGRHDLAAAHLRGLRDAAAGRAHGPAPAGALNILPAPPLADVPRLASERLGGLRGRRVAIHPDALAELPPAERDAFTAALAAAGAHIEPLPASGTLRALPRLARRWLLGPRADLAVIPSRPRLDSLFAGRWIVQTLPGATVLRRSRRVADPARAAFTLARGTLSALRLARRRGEGPSPLDTAYAAAHASAGRTLSLEAIVLAHNRWPALERTLETLLADPAFDPTLPAPRTITVVDNASTDGTPDRVEAHFAHRGVRLLRLESNLGVDAFNRAVERSTADAVLILDDDAAPDAHALSIALARLAENPRLGAVTLHPRHPKSGRSEWPFAASLKNAPTDRWPVMGCANLVRRAAWNAAGGYEPAFFLYRNDADLALKLLALGHGVHFDPALVAWHDSPAGPGARKSPRWHHLATRNWLWMARRHAPLSSSPAGLTGLLMGWLWAHKLAGLSPARHAATLRGLRDGLFMKAPAFSSPSPEYWARYMKLQTRRR